MVNELLRNIDAIHTTELGIVRIRRNIKMQDEDVIAWCKEKILASSDITRKGKNWYVRVDGIVITVNAHSFTIITAHRQ